MVRACLDILLKLLPCLENIFSGFLLEVRNFATKEIGFIDGEEYGVTPSPSPSLRSMEGEAEGFP